MQFIASDMPLEACRNRSYFLSDPAKSGARAVPWLLAASQLSWRGRGDPKRGNRARPGFVNQ